MADDSETGPWQDYQAPEEAGPWQEYAPGGVAVAPPAFPKLSPAELGMAQAGIPAFEQPKTLGQAVMGGLQSSPLALVPPVRAEEPAAAGALVGLQPFTGLPPEVMAAAVNEAKGFGEFATSPIGRMVPPLMVGSPIIRRGLSLLFAGQLAFGARKKIAEAETPQDIVEGLIEGATAPVVAAGALPRRKPAPYVRTVTETTPPVPKSEIPAKPSATGILPAVRKVGGETVVGEAGQTHPEIMAENKIPREDVDQRVFVDQATGKVLDREQAAAATPGLPTATEPGRRHSTDLPEAKPPEETAAENQAMLQEELAKETPKAKEPWEMTKAEWDSARSAASKAELKAMKLLGGSPAQKALAWATPERIRLQYGAEASPIRKGGVPVVTHESVIRKALSEGNPVPAEVLADYPDLQKAPPVPVTQGAPPAAPAAVEAKAPVVAGAEPAIQQIDKPNLPGTQAATIERIVKEVGDQERRRHTVVERRPIIGSDGKTYYGGLPFGVKMVGSGEPYYDFQTREGTTVGKRYDTRQEAEAANEKFAKGHEDEMRKALSDMTPEQIQSQAQYWLKEPVTPEPETKPSEAPKAKRGRKPKQLLTADKISDFRPGIDRVVRRGDRAFVVDSQHERVDVEVASDKMTPELADRIRNLPKDKLGMARRTTEATPYLSPEGKAERLAIFDEVMGRKPTPAAPVTEGKPIPPRSLPQYGISSKDVAKQYGMPEDFYGTADETGMVSSKYRTPEYDAAVDAEKRVANLQGINATTIRRQARERTELEFRKVVERARAEAQSQGVSRETLTRPVTQPVAAVTEGKAVEKVAQKFQMTFEQFLKAPREGPLLEALRKLPRPDQTPEQKAAVEKGNAATAAIEKAGLTWIYDRADPTKKRMVEAAIRNLPKSKKKLVDAYEAALDEAANVSGSTEAGQRRLYDRAVKAGIIEEPKPAAPPETGPNLSVGPGAASPAEFAQRQAGANRAPPPPNPPVTTEPGEMPTPEVVRQAKDYHLFNRFNTGQWLFYFGRLGAAAKQAFEKSALAEFRMRESVMRDVRTFVRETFRELPRSVRKQGGKVFFEVLDGKTMEQVRSEWEGRPNGEAIIAQAEKVKTRLENIRTTIRDIKRDSFDRYLNAMNKDALVELFRENINRQSDISGMTKADLAHALTLDQFPDDWGISDGSYLPHLFFGQWKVTATMPGAEGAQFITRAQTIQEAKARIYEQTRANPEFRDAQFKIEQDTVVPADMIRLGDRRFWSLVAKMREQNMTQAEVKDALRGNIGRKSGREKWFGSLQERKGFEGYSKDYQRTMVAYLNGFHRWRVLTELNREVQPLIEQIRSEGRINAAQRLEQILDNLWGKPQASTRQFDAFIRRIPLVRDAIKPMALDRWARAATNLTGLLTLRTLRFSVVNRLQPLQTLYPLIGEQGIIEAKIMQHTARGRELLREAGVDLDPGQYAGEFGTGLRGREFIERFSGERSNQEVAFLGMYNHARKMGLSHQEAINYGKLRGQLMTQFTPLTVDSPEIFEGPFGRVMFQYKRFPIKTLELTSRMVADRNAPAIARIVAVLATLGGLSFFIRQTWFLDPDTRLRLKRNLDKSMGAKAGDALMYGLPGFLGADISGSITLGDEPMGKGIYEKTARMLTGPAISLGIETVKAATTPERKEASTIQQTETMLRRFPATKPLAELSSILRGDLDLRTPDGEIKLKRKLTDAIAGLGSFRSANEANISLAVNGIMALAKEESRLKNNWYMATDKPYAMKAISRFNAVWPEAAISTGDLIRYKHYRDTAGKKTDVNKTAGKRYRKLIPESQRQPTRSGPWTDYQ